MKRIAILLLAIGGLGLTHNSATAATIQVAVVPDGGQLAGSGDGDSYALKFGTQSVRYGGAGTDNPAVVALPGPDCAPVAGAGHNILVSCQDAAGNTTRAPSILDTRTGLIATPPGAPFTPNAAYVHLGRRWIQGQVSGAHVTATFIERETGRTLNAGDGAYDLDSITPTKIAQTSKRRGSRIAARSMTSAYTLEYSRVGDLQLVRGAKLIRTLEHCHDGCNGAIGVAGKTAAWVTGSRVYRYSVGSRKTTVSAFHAVDRRRVIQLLVQPGQVLVAVPRDGGQTRLYRLR